MGAHATPLFMIGQWKSYRSMPVGSNGFAPRPTRYQAQLADRARVFLVGIMDWVIDSILSLNIPSSALLFRLITITHSVT